MQTIQEWANEEFGRSLIADPRWRRRLQDMGAQAARRPAGRVSETFADDAARQGAYGLLESEVVSAEQVAASLSASCASRSAQHPFVFCAVDGSSLRLVDRQGCKNFGAVGTRTNGARGLKVINAMVLSPQGVPLGIGGQRWWCRPHRPRRKHRDKLIPAQKETHYWLEVMRQTRQAMAIHAPQTRCWFQLDREADAWPMLIEAAAEGHWFTIRSSHNRRVVLGTKRRSKLRTVLRRQPILATSNLEVPAAPNRKARTATMVFRACTMTLNFRDKRTGRKFPMTVNVVQTRERGSTPPGEKPLDWTLLTNHPVATSQDLFSVVSGYSMRWRIEEMHRTWKSGACRVEQTQLRSSSAAMKWASILSAVAVRIERIKRLSREQPQRPASEEFSPLEIQAVALLRFGKSARTKVPKGVVPTMEQVTLWIAQIGGYTGKSSGGPPGSITIARGLKDVRATVRALEALQ
jgi:Transposase DNA-binding/Transposase Tn5 dimerisation domain